MYINQQFNLVAVVESYIIKPPLLATPIETPFPIVPLGTGRRVTPCATRSRPPRGAAIELVRAVG